MWRPLVTDPQERVRLLAVIRDIVDALEGATVGTRRVATHCDHAMLHAYLARDAVVGDDDAVLTHVAAAIAAQADPPHSLGLHDGLAGVGWTITHLASDANAEEVCTSIDDALLHALDGEWRGGYDLIGGLVGIGVYALERANAGRVLAARALALLGETAQARGRGLAWKTSARQLPLHQRAEAPEGYWNLGLAHGVPGVIAFCARCVAYDVEAPRARQLLTGAVSYMLDAEPETDSGRFGTWQLPDGTCAGDRTRLAWCYGDLGVAAALLAAAHVEPRWEDDARRLARACASRPPAASVRDTGLCHGAAGIAHAFNRMHHATGDAALGEAARRWLAITLEMRNDRAYAGFPAFDGVRRDWQEDPTLVSGAVGVALMLHAMVSDVEPLWDRTLLLDLDPT